MHLVLPNGLQIELFRACVVEFCEVGGVMDVTSLCGGREATLLHVLDKPLSERCHSSLLQIGIMVTGITTCPVWRSFAPPTTAVQPQIARYCGRSAPITAKRFSSMSIIRQFDVTTIRPSGAQSALCRSSWVD